MKCCGYDRTTKYCSACGKSLIWNPKKILLLHYQHLLKEARRGLSQDRDERGQLKPRAQLTLNNIDRKKACIDWLEKQKE